MAAGEACKAIFWPSDLRDVRRSQKHDREWCHFVSGSLCMWRQQQGRHLWQKCLLRYEHTFFWSSLIKSEPTWLRQIPFFIDTGSYTTQIFSIPMCRQRKILCCGVTPCCSKRTERLDNHTSLLVQPDIASLYLPCSQKLRAFLLLRLLLLLYSS